MRSMMFAALPLLALWLAPAERVPPEPSTPNLTRAEMEDFLRTARIVRVRTLSKGVTQSLRATLTDGRITHDAHVQGIDESRTEFRTDRTVEMNFRDTYKFNIAAYRLGLLLAIDSIPVSVERKVAGKTCAVTWWVDHVLMDEGARRHKKIDPPDQDRWNRQMHTVRVFDQLIYNTDRNLGNLLICEGWNVHMIDHTRAFRRQNNLQEPRMLRRCDRVLLERLRALDEETLAAALRPYVTAVEIQALLARRDRIVALFDHAVAEQGEPAVLYDFLHPPDRASK